MSKDKGIALRPRIKWTVAAGYRAPDTLPPESADPAVVSRRVMLVGHAPGNRALKTVGQSYRPAEHFQQFEKHFLNPRSAHRRRKHTVQVINFFGRYNVMKSKCLPHAALWLR